MHSRRLKQGKELLAPSKREAKACCIPGCNKAFEARGWCQMHYNRWRKHGDPLKKLPSAGRKFSAWGCAQISAAKKGTHMSEATRAKQSEAHKGKKRSPASIAKTSGPNHYKWKGGQIRTFGKRVWLDLRVQVLERAGRRCEQCGKAPKRLVAHHIIPYDKGGIDAMNNLVCWCTPCHARHHNRDTFNKPK